MNYFPLEKCFNIEIHPKYIYIHLTLPAAIVNINLSPETSLHQDL